MIKPDRNTHMFLLSSPCRLTGEYSSEEILLTHAWPNSEEDNRKRIRNLPGGRSYFIVAFKSQNEPIEPKPGTAQPIPSYEHVGEIFCILLSVFYGKRFSNHGQVQSNGLFYAPNLATESIVHYERNIFDSNPRKAPSTPLSLNEFGKISGLLMLESLNERALGCFMSAARFYMRSLRNIESDVELSYLDFITCGEVLSGYYTYADNVVYDEGTLELFRKLESCSEFGPDVAKQLKGRLRQIKRRFVNTFMILLSEAFFQESEQENLSMACLSAESLRERLSAAYDLRSSLLHSGVGIGRYVGPFYDLQNEVQIFRRCIESNKELEKKVHLAPTIVGFEKMIRFCLLRFVHLNLLNFDSRLDGDGLVKLGQEDSASNI